MLLDFWEEEIYVSPFILFSMDVSSFKSLTMDISSFKSFTTDVSENTRHISTADILDQEIIAYSLFDHPLLDDT